jgi:F-type H+-transporting ATPase subunit b
MIVRSAAVVATFLALAFFGTSASAFFAAPPTKAPAVGGDAENPTGADHGKDHGHEQRLHGEPQPQESIHWDPYLFLFTLVLFLVMLYLLNRYAWQPILANLAERDRRVDEIVRQAEIANEDLQRLKLDMDKSLAAAHEEVRKTLDQVRADASKDAEELMNRAKEEAAAERAQALAAVEQAKREAQASLRDASIDLATKMAGKFVDRPLDAGTVRRLADGGTR